MKLSNETIEVLKNFSTINQSIVFNAGNEIKTISPSKTVMSIAKVKEDIPSTFGIYDLSQFLNVVGVFQSPDIEILDNKAEISEGDQKVNYVFADTSLITTPPAKEINFPEADVNFSLSSEKLKKLKKAAAVIGSPEVAVSGDRENIYMEALNTKNSSDNSYKITLGETAHKFRLVFNIDNLKIMDKDYDVSISSKGMSRFKNEEITYYVAIEGNSEFEA